MPAEITRRIAAEIADVAFNQTITIETPWKDCWGRRRETFVGRPVSIFAMRGVSAHSNGFQTCRALHLLQLLLGAVDCPGGFRFRPPFPRPSPPAQKPAGKTVAPNTPLPGPPLGYPTSPDDLLVDGTGGPLRIDEAYSWGAPLTAHGLMHIVIANAWQHKPYVIDTLFLYMANMAWNSSMNPAETMRMLTDCDESTGDYRIPHIIYSIPSGLTSGVLALSLNYAETIRAGIQSVSRGQREATQALGLSCLQVACIIIGSQAMRIIIPPAGAQFVSMLKDSSLVSIMGLWELNFLAQSYGRSTSRYIQMLLTAAFIYWALSIVSEMVQHRVEVRFGGAYGATKH